MAEQRERAEIVRVARAVALVAGVRAGGSPAVTERIAATARAIAERLGLDAPAVDRCEAAGWLRDVGLVALPDVILSPARGDRAADSPVRRTHVVLGEQAVRRVPEIAAVAGAIRHHHERFDGAGYPDGLVGVAAPIESRVVACAEEVVALVPDAPDGRARRQGITRLRERAGGMLDPTVVEVAVAVVTTTGEPAGRSMPRAA